MTNHKFSPFLILIMTCCLAAFTTKSFGSYSLFSTSPQSISICKNSGSHSIDSLIGLNDSVPGQTTVWIVKASPSHGILNGFNYTAVSTGGTIFPSGLTYSSTTGFSGVDSFKVQVCDSVDTVVMIIIVTVDSLPVINVSPVSPSICYGTNKVITASGASTYIWSPTSTLSSSTGSIVTAAPIVTSVYTLVATDLNGCSATVTDSIYVNTIPSPPAVTTPIDYCQNASDSNLAATGSSLLWYTTATGGTGFTASPLPSTSVVGSVNYYVSQTVSGCESGRDSIEVVVKPIPTVSVSPATATICAGGDTLLTASGAVTYSWIPSTGTITSSGVSIDAYPTTTTIYTVTGTAANGCTSRATRSVTVHPLPAAITVYGTTINSTCVGHQIRLLDATPGGIWSTSNPAVATINSSGYLTGIDSNNVTVTYFDTITGCSTNKSFSVNDDSLHLGTFNTCNGNPITVYSFAVDTLGRIDSTNWGSFNGMTIGIDNVTFTYSSGGGCEVDYRVVTNTLPDPIIGNFAVCVGATDTLSNVDSGGTWSSQYSSIAAVDSITGAVTGIRPDTVNIYFKLPTGCYDSALVTVNPLPVLTVTPTNPLICFGKDTTLSVAGADTYTWYASSGIAISTSPSVNIAPTVTSIYSVTGVDDNGCVSDTSTLVTVVALPIVSVTPSSDTICQGGSALLVATGAVNYNWAPLTGISTSSGSSKSASPPSSVVYTVIGTNANNCTSTATGSVKVNVLPTITITPGSAAICVDGDTTLTATGGISYSWAPPIGLSATTGSTVMSTLSSSTTYTVTGTDSNGCINNASKIVTVNPTPVISPVLSQTVCSTLSTASVAFTGTVSGTTYSWTNNNTSIGLAASGIGNISSFVTSNTGSAPETATITVTPEANGCSGISTNFTITVNPTPTLSPIISQTVCNTATTSSVTFASPDSSAVYDWTNSNSSIGLSSTGTGNINNFTASNTGSGVIIATVTVTPIAYGCSGSPENFTITVNPTPTLSPVASLTVCNTSSVAGISFASSVTGTVYDWTNRTAGIGIADSGIGSIGAFTATNTGATSITSTLTVTPSFDGCTGNSSNFTITVNPTPIISPITSQTVCNTATTSSISFLSSVSGTTYSWSNNNTGIGLAAAGTGTIASFSATNSTTAAVVGTIAVSPTANGCEGSLDTFTITVEPAPSVFPLSNQVTCDSATISTIAFDGNPVSGVMTSYIWSNSNTSIGLTSSGTGNIDSFIATNASTVSQTATITVTPQADMCNGGAQIFTITVNPKPTVGSIGNQIVCNDSTVSTISFSGAVSGTTYTWTNTDTSIGLSATGSGNILPFTATNASSVAVTGTVLVTPQANGCTGTAEGFMISINPSPSVSVVPGETYCNATSVPTIYFSGSDVSGTIYNWASNNSTLGFPASGSDSINTYTATNSGAASANATITVTPTANGCNGLSRNFIVTVNPTPNLIPVPSQTVCNTVATEPVAFSSSVAGCNFNWTNSDTTIGLSATGVGTISSFTAINTGTTPVISIVTVTPTANSCPGPDQTFSITVNPAPYVSALTGQVICDSELTSTIFFSGIPVSGFTTTYDWTSNNTAIGVPAAGTDSIGAFTAMNSSSSLLTSTITVTPQADMCSGSPQSFTITVNPMPSVYSVGSKTVCNNTSITSISFNGPVSGTTFAWTNSDSTIGLASAGSGNINSFVAMNTGSVAVTATVTVTPMANGCTGDPEIFTIKVNPTASVLPVTSQTVCNTMSTSTVVLSGPVSGTIYSWSNDNPSVGLPATGTGTIPSFTGTNTNTVTATATITITPQANGCTGTPGTFTVTIKPSPTVDAMSGQTVCNGLTTLPISFSGIAISGFSTSYSWTNNLTSIGLASSGTGTIGSFTATNTGTIATIATLMVTPEANGCSGSAQNFTITVYPTPVLSPIISQIVCNTASTMPDSFASSVSGTIFTWANSTSIGLATTGTGMISSFTATNSGTSPIIDTVTVTPMANSCIGATQSFYVTVDPAPTVFAVTGQVLCDSAITTIAAFSGTPVSGDTTIYSWTNSNSSIGLPSTGTGNIAPFTATNSGTAIITSTITVTPQADMCSGAAQQFTITVNPKPTVAAITSQTVCNTASTSAVAFTGSVSGTTFTWANSNPGIGLATTGSGNISSFAVSDPSSVIATASITVTPAANGCSGDPKYFTYQVNPTPSVSATADMTICNGLTIAPVTFGGSAVTGTTYDWTNSNTSIGLASTGTNAIGSFTATNTGSIANTATITVTPIANGCSGEGQYFTIIVDPTPVLAAITSQTVCNTASTSSVSFSSSVTGSTYTWTNTDSSIGLAATGSGIVPSFIATDTTSGIKVATVTVTPQASTCLGPSRYFTILVNPTPSVSAVGSQTVCNNSTTSPISFGGSPVTATAYNWTNNNTSIGLAATGTGDIPAFTATNTSGSMVTATITVTAEANGCPGNSEFFTISVNPTPSVTPVGSQTVCNTASTALISFGGSAVSGTTYNWTNSSGSIGLPTTGSGNISSFSASNTGSSIIISTVTVTPEAAACYGTAELFTITVDPTPSVSAVGSQTVCNSNSTSAISFGGSLVIGTNYNWAGSTSAIGIAGSGTGSIPSFTALNSGALILIDTITVTSEANGCNGNSDTFTITVDPTPTVFAIPGQTLCNNAATDSITFGGLVGGTTYNWINSLGSIGLASSGTGNIASFYAANPLSIAEIATVTVTPHANSCNGAEQDFTITVDPTPSVSPIISQTICSTSLTDAVSFGGSSVIGTVYNWTNNTASIGLASTGAGNIPAFVAINDGSIAEVATVTVTPDAAGCTGEPQNFTVTVNPLPTNIFGGSSVCVASAVSLFDTTSGGNWSSSNTSIASINLAGIVSGLSYGTDTIVYTLPTGCLTKAAIVVNPLPDPIIGADSVCVNADIGLFDGTSSGIWSSGNTSLATINSVGIVTGISPGADTINYSIGTGCKVSFPVRINPLPEPLYGDTAVCVGSTVILTDSTGAIAYDITAIVPGVTTITLATLSGCSSHISILVNPLPANIEGVTGLCLGTNSLLTDSVSGGVWSSSDTSIASINDTGLVAALSIGTATISYTLPTGCYKTTEVHVNHLFTISNLTITDPTTCSGYDGSITLYGLGTGITYDVNYLKDGIPDTTAQTSNSLGEILIDSLSAGTYDNISVSLTGCTSNFRDTVLVDPPPPSTPSITDNSPLCNGTTLHLYSTDSTPGVAYFWTGPAGFTSSLQNTNIDSIPLSDSGYYRVKVELNNCFSFDSVFVHLLTVPGPSVIYGDSLLCLHTTDTLTDTVIGGTWSCKNADATIGSTGVLTGVHIGTDTVQYSYSNTCGTTVANKIIEVITLPDPGIITGPDKACVSTESSYLDSISPGIWTVSNATAIINDSGQLSALVAGTDTVIYTVSNVCGDSSTRKVININNNPHSHIAIHSEPTACTNTLYQNFGADSATAVGVGYNWHAINAVVFASSYNRQNSLVSFNDSGNSIVILTALDSTTGCYSSDSFRAVVGNSISPEPTVSYYGSIEFVCQDNIAASYQWGYDNKITLDSTLIPGEINEDYFNTSPDFTDNYYWVMTIQNGCLQKSYYNTPLQLTQSVFDNIQLILYPNPADNEINIQIIGRNGKGNVDFQLFDISGNKLSRGAITGGKGVVKVSQYSPGVYLIMFSVNGEIIGSQTFVKNN